MGWAGWLLIVWLIDSCVSLSSQRYSLAERGRSRQSKKYNPNDESCAKQNADKSKIMMCSEFKKSGRSLVAGY